MDRQGSFSSCAIVFVLQYGNEGSQVEAAPALARLSPIAQLVRAPH